jgi:hypothetical protein
MDTAVSPFEDAPELPGEPPTVVLWHIELEVIGELWFPKWTGPALHYVDAVKEAKLAFYGRAGINDPATLERLPVRVRSSRRFPDRRQAPRDERPAEIGAAIGAAK